MCVCVLVRQPIGVIGFEVGVGGCGLLTVEHTNFSCEQGVFLEMPASIVLLTQCFSSQAEPVNVFSRESQILGVSHRG